MNMNHCSVFSEARSKIIKIVLICIILLLPPLSHSISRTTTSAIRYSTIAMMAIYGVINTYFTGLNIPNVSNQIQKKLDTCNPESIGLGNQTDLIHGNATISTELRDKIEANCLIPQYYEGGQIGFLAMLGTLAPSVDAPLWLGNGVFLVGTGVLVALDLAEISGGVGAGFLLVRLLGATYTGWAYGKGDENGAEGVGKQVIKTAAFNTWCQENPALCIKVGKQVYLQKPTNETELLGVNVTSWRDEEKEKSQAYTYKLLNRLGGATVGFTLGYSLIDTVLFPVELGIHIVTTKLSQFGNGIQAAYLRSLTSILDKKGHVVFNGVNKLIAGAKTLASPFIVYLWFGPNPIEHAAAPLWNGKEYNAAALYAINNLNITDPNEKEKFIGLKREDLEARSDVVIALNDNGILYHKDDPNQESYSRENCANLDCAADAISFIVENSHLGNWTEEQITNIDEERNQVGIKLYGPQFRLLTVGSISNLARLPENIMAFKAAYGLSKRNFAGDIIWNLANGAAIIPYDINLYTWIGGDTANGVESINALITRLSENRVVSGGEMLANEKAIVDYNTVLINVAWLGNPTPRWTNLRTKTFVNPYTDMNKQAQIITDEGKSLMPVADIEMQPTSAETGKMVRLQ